MKFQGCNPNSFLMISDFQQGVKFDPRVSKGWFMINIPTSRLSMTGSGLKYC